MFDEVFILGQTDLLSPMVSRLPDVSLPIGMLAVALRFLVHRKKQGVVLEAEGNGSRHPCIEHVEG